MLVGQQVGGLGVSAGVDQGVEQAGAVVAGIAAVVAAAGRPAAVGITGRGRNRSGLGLQGCLEQGCVLGGAAAADPRAAGMVVCDGQETLQVGRPVLAVQLTLVSAIVALGVDHRE